jgi:putative hydrolase of the HAD superfamily
MNSPLQDLDQRLAAMIAALNRPLAPEITPTTAALTPLSGIRAVLFDVYGTMFVSASGDIGAARGGMREEHLYDALKSVGYSRVDVAAGVRGIQLMDQYIADSHEVRRRKGIGNPEVDILEIWRKVIRELLDTESVEGTINEELIRVLAVDYECRVNPVWPMPHLRETVDALHESGRKLGIVSNAQFYTPLMLAAFSQTGWNGGRFDEDLCAWSYRLLEAKPSERLVQSVLHTLKNRDGINPSQVLCIGNDMLNDVLPAARLGCKTALFAGDARSYRPRETELRGLGVKPDLVVSDLLQIPESLT